MFSLTRNGVYRRTLTFTYVYHLTALSPLCRSGASYIDRILSSKSTHRSLRRMNVLLIFTYQPSRLAHLLPRHQERIPQNTPSRATMQKRPVRARETMINALFMQHRIAKEDNYNGRV